jgi:hypothetical protein
VAWYYSGTARAATLAAKPPQLVREGPSRRRANVLTVPSSIDTSYQRDVTNDASGSENEGSVVAFTRSATNATYTDVSYQQGDASHNYTIGLLYSTDPQGAFTRSANPYYPVFNPSVPGSGFTDAFDTSLIANQYSDGVRPGALYLTSCLAWRSSPAQGPGNPSAIRVWASDDGGATWTTSGQTVDSAASADSELIDKPVSAISAYPPNRGSIYVSWTRVPVAGGTNSRVLVRRNQNGLWQYCRPATGACETAWDATLVVNDGTSGDAASAPQVVVNPENGNLYVFWLSLNGEIRMRRMLYGATWSADSFVPALNQPAIAVASGILIPTRNNGYLPNGLRANVLPTIKYNVATHSVIAVWHTRVGSEPPLGTNETAIYYTSFNPDTITSPAPSVLINDAAGSQIQPAVDFDANGNSLITYYSTENFAPQDTTSTCWNRPAACARYQVFAASVTSTGAVGAATLINSGPNGGGFGTAFLGDYHENFYFTYPSIGGLWTSTWTANAGSYTAPAEDIWLTQMH